MHRQNKKPKNMKRNRNMKITSVNRRNDVELIAPIQINRLRVPYLEVKFFDYYLTFVIDTGASESFIDGRVFNIIKDCLKVTESNSLARCVDGSEITSGLSANMKFNVNGKNCTATLQIMEQTPQAFDIIAEEEGIRIHGILGIDFLTSNNLILDFCNNIIVRYNANKVA